MDQTACYYNKMIDFQIAGAIFDVDDTLLDNQPGVPGQGLHERSRLAAAHTVGKAHGIPALENLTAQRYITSLWQRGDWCG